MTLLFFSSNKYLVIFVAPKNIQFMNWLANKLAITALT